MYLFKKLLEKVKWQPIISCHILCYILVFCFLFFSHLLVIFLLISYLGLGWTRNEMEF